MTKSLPGAYYENISGVDVYSSHEIDETTLTPKIRFYRIKKDGSRQFFRCEYAYHIHSQPVEDTSSEIELKRIIREELTAEIERYLK